MVTVWSGKFYIVFWIAREPLAANAETCRGHRCTAAVEAARCAVSRPLCCASGGTRRLICIRRLFCCYGRFTEWAMLVPECISLFIAVHCFPVKFWFNLPFTALNKGGGGTAEVGRSTLSPLFIGDREVATKKSLVRADQRVFQKGLIPKQAII